MTPHCVKSVSPGQFELALIFMVRPPLGILEQHVYLYPIAAITHYFVFQPRCLLSISSLNSKLLIFFGLSSQKIFSHT